MPDYMVIAAFTSEPDAAMLPDERERLKELVDRGVLLAAYLSTDRSAAWLVLSSNGPVDVQKAMESLPLYPYMEIQEIVEAQQIILSNT